MQDTPQTPQIPQEIDEFDATADIEALQGIEKELRDVEASLENNFAEWISEIIEADQTYEELFFNDKKLFFKKILELQNQFVKELIEPRVAKAEELQGNIKTKQELGQIDLIKRRFQAAHPDVDIKELILFYTNELPPKLQEQIKAQPVEQFFDLIYELYQQATKPQEQPQEEELPKQTQGVAINSDYSNTGAGQLPMERY